MTPLAARMFGAWTMLAGILRCYCAFNMGMPGYVRYAGLSLARLPTGAILRLYRATMLSYVLVLGVFGSEIFRCVGRQW